jgi:hypothetical protein
MTTHLTYIIMSPARLKQDYKYVHTAIELQSVMKTVAILAATTNNCYNEHSLSNL